MDEAGDGLRTSRGRTQTETADKDKDNNNDNNNDGNSNDDNNNNDDNDNDDLKAMERLFRTERPWSGPALTHESQDLFAKTAERSLFWRNLKLRGAREQVGDTVSPTRSS